MICLFGGIFSTLAQKHELNGKLIDSENNQPLIGATVVLLNTDSTMHSFTISDANGDLKLRNIAIGEYVLQVTFIGYQAVTRPLHLKTENDYNIGSIQMEVKNELLDDVTIAAERIPIQMNHDTLEYNVAAFKTKPNASVEELLKKLPGVEVEQDGTIKAQGETVNKVLVDGKEFFGDDPQIATKNLPADALDKVQVFDKLSDLAEFTGIDDGTRDKTINLSLKEDKKNGLFGKLQSGYGDNNEFIAKGNVNQFTKNRQVSALVAGNNVNQQNFSFDDYIRMSGGIQNLLQGNGTIEIDDGMGGALGGNSGINTVWSGGVNFNQDIGKKWDIGLNYFYNNLQNDLKRSSNRQNFNGDSLFTSNSEENTVTNFSSHRLNSKIKYTIDKNHDIIFRSTLGLTDQDKDERLSSNTLSSNGSILNQSSVFNDILGNSTDYDGNLLFRKKFNKKGRVFTAQGIKSRERTHENSLIDNTLLAGSNSIAINQNQEELVDEMRTSVNSTYTEPLWKNNMIQLSYNYEDRKFENTKDFFDRIDFTEIQNDSLSNAYESNFSFHRAGFRFRSIKKKTNLAIGLMAQSSELTGNGINFNERIARNYFNWLPSAHFRYNIATGTNLEVSYRTNVLAPQITQLQPVVTNTNPLVVYTGNPDLENSYQHDLAARYMLYDQFSFTSLFVRSNFRITTDKITNSSSLDENLIQTIKPINTDYEYLWTNSVSFSTPLRFMKSKIGLDYSNRFIESLLVINGQENTLNRRNNTGQNQTGQSGKESSGRINRCKF